jgi:hypothetical protein
MHVILRKKLHCSYALALPDKVLAYVNRQTTMVIELIIVQIIC